MGLKKAENQVKHLLGDTIVALCRNTLSHAAEINVEGLIGITLDKEEIFLVNISQTIEIPEAAAKKQEKRQSHKRQSTADQDDQSLSDESSSEDSGDQTDDSSPRKKRRRRHRRKRRSNARAQDVVGQTTRSSHVSVNAPEQTIANEGPVSNQSSLMPNISMDSSLPNVPPVIDVNPNVNQTLPQHSQGSTVDNQQGESSFTNITLQTNTGRPSSCSNDTDQNGVNVKDEVMSDDNDDEDLVIVKEEIGDNSYPNPVYIFPNVSQSLSQNESLLSPSFTNASMTSPTQSQPSAGPVPGPSNFVQSSGVEAEMILPRYSEHIQNHLNGGTVEQVWNKFISETANHYHYCSFGLAHCGQYQKIGEIMYNAYPCIRMESGAYPWSYFTKCLSQKIRHIRHFEKRNKTKIDETVQRMNATSEAEETDIVPPTEVPPLLKELQDEWKKSAESRDTALIKDLLRKTRPHRIMTLLKNKSLSLKEAIDISPCLQDGYYVVYEFQEKFGVEKWDMMKSKTLLLVKACYQALGCQFHYQGYMEREEKILEAFNHIEHEAKYEGTRAGPAKVTLPVVAVYEDIDDSDMPETLNFLKGQALKLVAFKKDEKLQSGCYIVGNEVVIKCHGDSFLEYILQLIAVFKLFDIEYPQCHSMILAVFQVFVLEEPVTYLTSRKYKFFCNKLRKEFEKLKLEQEKLKLEPVPSTSLS